MARAFLVTILFAFAVAIHGQTAESKPAFEVVSIKPSAPYDPRIGQTVGSRGGPGTDDPGLVTYENNSLADLVILSYDIAFFRLSAPDWMKQQRFNVAARVPPGSTKAQFRLMLQNMLAERFKLAVHFEKKEMQISELVVAKGGPKLRESAPEPPAKEGGTEPDRKPPAAPEKFMAKDGYPAVTEGMAMGEGRARMVYRRQTMQFFTIPLSSQLGHPVIDATGLTGKYDFAIFWDYRGTSDPDAGPTLREALQSQLGLRLESKKEPMDIVVVDHAEKVPTEN